MAAKRVPAMIFLVAGGSAVLLYASKYQDVGTVVNISGRCFTANGVKERLGEQGLQEIEKNGFFDVNDRFGSVVHSFGSEVCCCNGGR